MAGEWLKFDASTPDKPEVLAITVAMGWDDPDLTVGKLLRVWRWFDQQTIDGNAVGVTAALLDRLLGVSGLCAAMAKVGWLLITDEGLSLPNFDRHNGKTAKDRALTAKRVANHKANAQGNGKGNGASVSGALPREEKSREEDNPLNPPAGGKARRRCRIPDGFNPSEDGRQRAVQAGLDADAEIAKFRDHHAAKGSLMADWDAAWRTWVGNAVQFGRAKVQSPSAKPDTPEYAALHKNASWWRDAGFPSVWEAMANKCWHSNAHLFRDGKRVEVAA